ncbi:MAG: glycosyltransferase [Acidobacteriota bacterium]|nr:glycosyltransferase [Acidobacteriota bacterium]
MRVLHVLPSVAPSYGGPSAALIGLSRALATRGVYSETVTTDLGYAEGSLPCDGRLTEDRNMRVRYFPRLFSQWLPRDFALSPQLGRWLKVNVANYDIVNIHGLFNYPSSMAAAVAYKAGVPYIIRPCGMLDPWCLRQRRMKKRLYLRLYDDQVLRRAAAISFTTDEEARVAYKVSPTPTSVVIPLGVDQVNESNPETVPLPTGLGKQIILFLSRIDQKKGLDLLLLALARLRQVRDDFLCVIAGNGSAAYEAKIKNEVYANNLEGWVHFTGFVEGKRKQQLLKNAACFVLPSYQENFGVSVVEAMSAGCPVIISDQVNLHKEVSAAHAGWVIHCDADELFRALNRILSDETSRRVMGTNGQTLAREKYSWGNISRQVLSLYEICVRRHHCRDFPDLDTSQKERVIS